MSSSNKKSPQKTQIFTARQLVGRMCELCEPQLSDPTKKIFEPSCGSGNFLVEVLQRRLLSANFSPRTLLTTLSNLYGLDIDAELVTKTRQRLRKVISDFTAAHPEFDDQFFSLVDRILVSNIIVGDLLKSPEKITFCDWTISAADEPDSNKSDTNAPDPRAPAAKTPGTSAAKSQRTSAVNLTLVAEPHALSEIMAASRAPAITLRPEQETAVAQTHEYWQQHHSGGAQSKFLWNAKPRFGKTFTTYQFAQRIDAQRVLIVSNRPAISDSWSRDFCQYVAPNSDFVFASAKGGDIIINGTKFHIYSRTELLRNPDLLNRPLFFFISLQDLKGKDGAGNFKSKNQWIFKVQKPWDLLIIDESHDGVSTAKTRQTLAQIKTNFALHLSGTPFRALVSQEFSASQIFNWTYLDEQAAKANYQSTSKQAAKANSQSADKITNPETNPYSTLPRLELYTYNLADFLGENSVGSCELFRTKSGQFIHEKLVRRWLDLIPETIFSRSLPSATAPNREYFRHTFWLLSHVDECRALAKLLREHPFFQNHEIVIAAGKDETNSSNPQRALSQVRRAIGDNPRQSCSITLSCGQLTTGITVPEWTAALMLGVTTDLAKSSSAQYLQAAFRAQNPWQTPNFSKDVAYIFDWSPDRALLALRDYAINLCARSEKPITSPNSLNATNSSDAAEATTDVAAVSSLLKYLPAYSSTPKGDLIPLSAEQIVTLPAKLAAQEIVDGAFVSSDKLFRLENIAKLSPAAHRVINKLYALKKHGFETTPQPIASTLPPTSETNVLAKKSSRSHKKKFEEDYRAKMRGFTSAIPLLLHLYGQPGQTLRQLVAATPDSVFLELVGISKFDFQTLAQENFFNEANCTAAIAEFMAREQQLAKYYNLPTMQIGTTATPTAQTSPSAPQTIFAHIPPQRQYVFTPLPTIERMLDYLELSRRNDKLPLSHSNSTQPSRPHLAQPSRPHPFHSRETTILDLCSKSGLFIAMAVRRLYQNLRPTFSSDHDCLLHILTHQVYVWSPDAIARETTLRTVLSFARFSKDEKDFFPAAELAEIAHHFVVYNPSDGKSVINYVKVLRETAEFWENDVKFDIIIGNPPYQSGRRQVYADFYRLAADLDPELLCLIFPLGWQKVTNTNGLKQLNNLEYKRDPHLVLIDNYYENDDRRIFPEIGTGGVNIVLRDNQHDNRGKIRKFEYGAEISSTILPVETDEVEKPVELDCLRNLIATNSASSNSTTTNPAATTNPATRSIASLGSARRPYGFCAEPLRRPWKYQLDLRDEPQNPDDVRLFGLFANGERGYKFISRRSLPKPSPNLDAYKLFVPKAWGNMSRSVGLGGSYSNLCLARPGDVCAETFIEFGPFATQDEAFRMAKYFFTKFFRACLFLAKTSQNTARDKYRYVPLPDFSQDFWQKSIAEIDEKLFAEYQIPAPSRDFIRQNFQTRSEENIDIL